MDIIYNAHQYAWRQHINNETYLILFGNQEADWECTKEELKSYWTKAIRCSKYKLYGDITLLYKGKIIRACHNLEKKITEKNVQYKCQYNKYPYKES